MKFNKNLAIGLFSCSIESYTASIYVFAGPELKSQIFPYLSPDSATFFHYMIIALGLLCYPLGGYLFGFLGDKLGRKKALTYSSLGLAVATALLGLVPLGLTGDWLYIPAILFTALFCLQHFCSGGDYSSSAIFTVEHVEKDNHAKLIYYSGLACVMSVAGLIIAQFMSAPELWRLGCFTGFIGALFAFYIRKKSEETPIFVSKEHTSIEDNSTRKLEQLIVFMFAGFLCAVYYFVFVFLTPHLFIPHGYALSTVNILYFVLYAISLWLGGIIVSKMNLLKTTQDFCFILILLLGLFMVVGSQLNINSTTTLTVLSFITALIVILMGLIIGPQHALYLKLFPQRKRCQSIITYFTLGAAAIGGITPFFCKLIYQATDNFGLTALWPVICTGGLIASLVIYHRRPLNLNRVPPFKSSDKNLFEGSQTK